MTEAQERPEGTHAVDRRSEVPVVHERVLGGLVGAQSVAGVSGSLGRVPAASQGQLTVMVAGKEAKVLEICAVMAARPVVIWTSSTDDPSVSLST